MEESIFISREERCRILSVDHLADIAPLLGGESELFLVYDDKLGPAAGEIIKALPVRGAIGLEASEQWKNLETVAALCRQLMEAGASRNALLLALGGGTITDIAGFAAAIYKRGIRCAFIPTTVLSMADAAIGGKNGVNLDGYKNMLGTIVQPQQVFICPEVLGTLPPREWKCGLAEVAKTLFLADAPAYAAVVGEAPEMPSALLPFVLKAAAIKAGIVREDPFEKGARIKLNLGHSFAHAIEHAAAEEGDDISHGEAVAIGIILAAKLSEAQGIASEGLAQRLEADFTRLGLPTACPYGMQQLLPALRNDKKGQDGKLRCVLPEAPGKVVLKDLNPDDLHLDTE